MPQKPLISVFTPTNEPKYLSEAYESLKVQTVKDWEWIILPNGGLKKKDFSVRKFPFLKDPRIKVEWVLADKDNSPDGLPIGELKATACSLCTSPYHVELDHDDYLHEECLEKLLKAFDEGADFVYSGFAEFHDKTMLPNIYAAACGWRYYPFEYNNVKYMASNAFPPLPPWMLFIETGPNHVRSWRADKYHELGGHNRSFMAGDDYDLYMRFYNSGAKVVRIEECLYFYRYRENSENSFIKRNKAVHETVNSLYQEYVEKAFLRWCDDKNLLALDMGAYHNKPSDKRWSGVDVRQGPGVDFVADLDDPNKPWPWEDNSVGIIRAYDFIEHISNTVHMFNEIWRVLAPDGIVIIEVPSTDDGNGRPGRGAFQDPTHRGPYFNQNSFWYYTNDNYKAFVEGLTCAFYPLRCYTHYPSQFHVQHQIPYVRAHLVALKQGMAAPPPIPSMNVPT